MKRYETLRSCLTIIGMVGICACSHAPRSAVLDQSKAISESDNLSRARQLAPQAYARAEGLQESAEQAHSDGREALASALAERALVAFKRAAVQAQKVEATERIAVANHASGGREVEIAKLGSWQEAIAAETKRLELRIEVATNTMPRTPLEPEGGQRGAARAETARSLAEASRLLCVAARLVAPANEQIAALTQSTETLLTELATLPPHVGLERAMDQRVQCLAALTKAKRASTQRAPDAGDELLSSLSPAFADLRPHRDDRGVVLTALGAWDGRQLTPSGRDIVDRVSKLASARPTALLVVLHPAAKSGTSQTPGGVRPELAKLFPNASVVEATTALPSMSDLPTKEKHGGRMEFIFVTP
jgi:hypothetical protein